MYICIYIYIYIIYLYICIIYMIRENRQTFCILSFLGSSSTLGPLCVCIRHPFSKFTLPTWVYKTIRFSPLAVEHSVVVMTAGSQSRRSQIES